MVGYSNWDLAAGDREIVHMVGHSNRDLSAGN